jgi:hypothetical protein
MTHGQDSTGLGRWVWTRIHGTSVYNTSLFSAYRPCVSSNPGVNTVLAQHSRHLPAGSKEPREQFLLDLANAIQARQAVGDIIILGADLNQDVRHRRLREYFADLHMHNAITIRHPHLSSPATCHKNDSCTPIDGIWCSLGLHPVEAGFLRFGDATPSDHRALWTDFHLSAIIGQMAAEFLPYVTGLRASDPCDVGRYNLRSFAKLEAAKVPPSLQALHLIPSQALTAGHIDEYNRLAKINRQTRIQVRESLQHIYRGHQHWSPVWKQTLQLKRMWLCVVVEYRRRQRTGKHVSLTQIRRLMRTTNVMDALTHDENEAVSRLKQARVAHIQSIQQDHQLRDAYLISQDQAKADANSTTIEAEKAKRWTTEKQRKQGHKLAQLKQKRHNPVVKLLSTEADIASSWETKDDLERVSTQENQCRFSQTAATPPMVQPWILELVGYAGDQAAATAILDGTFAIPAHIDPYFARLLNALRMPESIRRLGPIPTSISTAEHIRG